jgi:carbonic anhydrase/acetyltransferase-like protein (isoleucine patch superfamily)
MTCYSIENVAPELLGEHWIAPSADVIGKVRLHHEVSVWFGAILRGDNDMITIGARSNIQDGCVLHVDAGQPLTIGEDCTIGHRAILHACHIGDGTLIGMGATVLNRAVIGKGCLVGANALVTEGKIFPDNTLIVGSPAKAIRTLDDEAVARLRASAAGYVANWKHFKARLLPIQG